MEEATSLKSIVVNAGEKSFQIKVTNICDDLGISQERFAELLARDFYCPIISSEPTSETLTYVDTDGTTNHFAIGQECFVQDVTNGDYNVFKFMGTYQDCAVWMKIAKVISELENDAHYATKQFVDEEIEKIRPKTRITTIEIDQAISDPYYMITRTVDEGGIEAIRANSHRYTGKLNADGVMELKQLDDMDGTKYLDGTAADLTSGDVDVWMKLPEFYWKCTHLMNDLVEISFHYGTEPAGEGWKHWDGKDLIGVYESSVVSSRLCSISGKKTFASNGINTYKNYAQAKGDGYYLARWKHHCMMGVLAFAFYKTTNIPAIIGYSSGSSDTGSTDMLGMEDTAASINGNNQAINFWGLEAWWGGYNEWLADVRVSGGVFTITEEDGTTRQITSSFKYGYISKMMFGEHLDLFPTEANASVTSGFCSFSGLTGSCDGYAEVRGTGNTSWNNVSKISCDYKPSTGTSGLSSRLSFRGDYIII